MGFRLGGDAGGHDLTPSGERRNEGVSLCGGEGKTSSFQGEVATGAG